ncbi:MAG TPA: hypothetical protein VEB21_10805 [Terriglobales bacterium]|nr:hypothetical protein [Terriglobales bacterium]
MRVFSWAAIAALVFLCACDADDDHSSQPEPAAFAVSTPGDGAVVETFDVAVVAEILATDLEEASIEALLNDSEIALTRSGNRLTATIEPGSPLRDDNTLVIRGIRSSGREVSSTSHFRYLPPKARARRITTEEELLRGPMAQNQIGDYLLENTVARFVVQDAPRRELANVGTYGGNLIDAELVRDPGRDNFLEIAPMVNVETVINPQTVEIVNDGQDGTAAIVRTCGPDDTLDFINPSSNIRELANINIPAAVDDADYDVEGCTDFVLEPEVARVQMVTTIFNQEPQELGLFVGDLIGGAGSLQPWQVSARNRNGIGEVLVLPVSALALIGFDDAEGFDYVYVPVPLPGAPIQTSDILAVSGVDAVLHSHSIIQAISGAAPSFRVPAGGSNSYARYFGVGDQGGADAVALVNEVMGLTTGTVRGCVRVGGAPAAGARVAIGPVSNGNIIDLVTHFVIREDGCFEGTLVPGNYGAAAARAGTPYEQSATKPLVHDFAVAAGETVDLQFDLPASAEVRVHIVDQDGQSMPGRVTLVGFDPSPDPSISTPILAQTATTFLFRDLSYDSFSFGVLDIAYAGADGIAAFDAEPGEYILAVSRGAEYSLFTQRVQLTSGRVENIEAPLARVLDTAGFLSCDFHVHGLNSTDSRTSNVRRTLQFAGEGVENLVMTEHHGRTDMTPTIAALGLERFIGATIGEEITSWEYGHYNGYPYDLVPGHQTGGSIDWARGAEPGRNFVEYGAYGMTPAELDAAGRSGPGSRDSTIVQANHVDGYYATLKIDSSLVPPQSFLSADEKLSYRLDPATENLFHPFAAMEIWNGHRRSHQDRFFNGHIGIWFNLLNQGIITSGTGVTDTHGYANLNAAGARTWTAAASDDPRDLDPDAITDAIAAGKATTGQGAYVETRLNAADGSGKHASHRLDDSTLVSSSNGAFDLQIRVQAPLWGEFDTIRVYANASTFPTGQNGGVNVLFGANPSIELHAGSDFAIERVNVAPNVPGGERLEANVTLPLRDLTTDTWIVVVVRGTDEVSRPMFPVAAADLRANRNTTLDDLVDGNLGENGVLAMAISNALYADVDGNGRFDAPLAP